MSDKPRSPCVGICQLDAQGVCLGCSRYADEIAEWGCMTDDQKRTVLARLKTEQEALQHAGND